MDMLTIFLAGILLEGKMEIILMLTILKYTRLYKSLNYKYSKANPDVLSKEQKKEYELYLKVKKEVEDERVKAAEAVDKYNTRKEES